MRPLYEDDAATARLRAEAALNLTKEYVAAVEQASYLLDEAMDGEVAPDGEELARYEQDIAEQLAEAEGCFDDGFGEAVLYDVGPREREEGIEYDADRGFAMPDVDRSEEEYYAALDDAYIAIGAVLDTLERVGEVTERDPLDEVELGRDYPAIPEDDREEHWEAMGLDRL
ncbi:MAG: hypothetical protein SV186_03350 [Candidatus Nanohaloarchaea archaeon]|nr:hypothetical protein [Candidatus Nanohaloarchaea archaeon]